ncbi:MAG: hypothetical protein ACO2O0_05635 [Desulfurococcales archaeon]
MLSTPESQMLAIPLIILGALLLVIGIIIALGPQIASVLRGVGIPEPLKTLLLVGGKAGPIEIYTSPILIIALAILYIAMMRR